MAAISTLISICGWITMAGVLTVAVGYTMAFLLACMIELGLTLNRLVGGDTRESGR
jgi:hypothetical protein